MSKYSIDSIKVYGGDWGERSESDPPAIDVKCFHFGRDCAEGCITDQLRADHPNLTEEDADKIGSWAWDSAVTTFWDQARGIATEHLSIPFEAEPEIECAGRSGGWLIVRGLPDVPTWSEPQRLAWGAFEEEINQLVAMLARWETIKEEIDSAGWVEECLIAADSTEVRLSPAELDTVIAALRYWQGGPNGPSARSRVLNALLDRSYGGSQIEHLRAIAAIATEHGPALDNAGIDALCERINTGGN